MRQPFASATFLVAVAVLAIGFAPTCFADEAKTGSLTIANCCPSGKFCCGTQCLSIEKKASTTTCLAVAGGCCASLPPPRPLPPKICCPSGTFCCGKKCLSNTLGPLVLCPAIAGGCCNPKPISCCPEGTTCCGGKCVKEDPRFPLGCPLVEGACCPKKDDCCPYGKFCCGSRCLANSLQPQVRCALVKGGCCKLPICKQTPFVTGHCRAAIPSWSFNLKTKKCEKFSYGGCGGNDNRFSSEALCQKTCVPTLSLGDATAEKLECSRQSLMFYRC